MEEAYEPGGTEVAILHHMSASAISGRELSPGAYNHVLGVESWAGHCADCELSVVPCGCVYCIGGRYKFLNLIFWREGTSTTSTLEHLFCNRPYPQTLTASKQDLQQTILGSKPDSSWIWMTLLPFWNVNDQSL